MRRIVDLEEALEETKNQKTSRRRSRRPKFRRLCSTHKEYHTRLCYNCPAGRWYTYATGRRYRWPVLTHCMLLPAPRAHPHPPGSLPYPSPLPLVLTRCTAGIITLHCTTVVRTRCPALPRAGTDAVHFRYQEAQHNVEDLQQELASARGGTSSGRRYAPTPPIRRALY
eukprot:2427746-Rhodomonas_salina.2